MARSTPNSLLSPPGGAISSRDSLPNFLSPPGSGRPNQSLCAKYQRHTLRLRAQRLKQFNLDWEFQSRLKISISIENFNPDLQNSPQKIGVCWGSRLKFSISIENFNPGRRSWIFSIFGSLGYSRSPTPEKRASLRDFAKSHKPVDPKKHLPMAAAQAPRTHAPVEGAEATLGPWSGPGGDNWSFAKPHRLPGKMVVPDHMLKKREGVPEMGTKPLRALRGYRASNRGSKKPQSRL